MFPQVDHSLSCGEGCILFPHISPVCGIWLMHNEFILNKYLFTEWIKDQATVSFEEGWGKLSCYNLEEKLLVVLVIEFIEIGWGKYSGMIQFLLLPINFCFWSNSADIKTKQKADQYNNSLSQEFVSNSSWLVTSWDSAARASPHRWEQLFLADGERNGFQIWGHRVKYITP